MSIIKNAKTLIILVCFCFLSGSAKAQTVKWLTWEEAIEKSSIEQRKFFVDIYTDWCTWCKKMDETTLSDPNIARYLNENFYPVKFNAQQKESVEFNGKVFKYVENGINSYHEFAFAIMNGKMKYPTVAFIDENYQVIQSIPGFRTPFELELFMTYFGEDNHENKPWYRFKREQESLKMNSLQIPASNN